MSENNSNDMIYNWRNELRSHHDGVFVVANSQAQKYKNQGFDKSEVVELLAADNFDLDIANRVASKLFDFALAHIQLLKQMKRVYLSGKDGLKWLNLQELEWTICMLPLNLLLKKLY